MGQPAPAWQFRPYLGNARRTSGLGIGSGLGFLRLGPPRIAWPGLRRPDDRRPAQARSLALESTGRTGLVQRTRARCRTTANCHPSAAQTKLAEEYR